MSTSESTPQNRPINTALCAFGMSGKVFHAPLLHTHQGFSLAKVWERRSQRASSIYPYVTVVPTIDEILNDQDIELLVVNTPEATHFEFVSRALDAGKHVVVEKAFTLNSDEAQKLLTKAKEKQLCLSIFQNRRWDNDFLTLQKVIASGMVGRIVEFESHFDRYRTYIKPDSWKEEALPGTGVLFNLGPHLIDQALALFGMPKWVFAEMRTQRTGGRVPDNFELILGYEELRVILKVNYLVKHKPVKFILLGELGSFVKYGIDPQEDALKAGLYPDSQGWGEESESEWGWLESTRGGIEFQGKVKSVAGNYLSYYDNIYEAIRNNAELLVSAQDGLNTMRIIDAALESDKEGRKIYL